VAKALRRGECSGFVNPGGIELAVRATESRGSRTAVNRTQKPNIAPNKVVSDRRVVSHSVSIVADLALPALTKCDSVGRDEMRTQSTPQKSGGPGGHCCIPLDPRSRVAVVSIRRRKGLSRSSACAVKG
jgi:hypothetical protein